MYVCDGTYSKCLEDIQMLDSNNRAGTFLVWYGLVLEKFKYGTYIIVGA